MLESFPVALLAGMILGCLAGMGVGGGSLMILWLTVIVGMDAQIARMINLLFFLPTAIFSTFLRWKSGTLPFRKVFPAMICGSAAAILLSLVSRKVDAAHLQKLLGLLLVVTGIRELFYRPRKAK